MICAIIPMYGFADITKKCIDYTIKNAGGELDILVVDDGSPEPFIDDRVHVLRLEENSGYTNATNKGIIWAMKQNYDYVLLLNNDTEPEPDFVKYLLEALHKEPNLGIVGSARIIYDDKGKGLIENFGIDLISGYQAYSNTDLDKEIIHVAWLPVCSALIPMDVIRQVGLLDKRMKIYCSDNDYCIRAQQLGYTVGLVPKSKVKHFHQTTTRSIGCYDQAAKDQIILLDKLSCRLQRQLLELHPISWNENSWGKLEFTAYTKEKECTLGQLNQFAAA